MSCLGENAEAACGKPNDNLKTGQPNSRDDGTHCSGPFFIYSNLGKVALHHIIQPFQEKPEFLFD
jgi:hypothetical protein